MLIRPRLADERGRGKPARSEVAGRAGEGGAGGGGVGRGRARRPGLGGGAGEGEAGGEGGGGPPASRGRGAGGGNGFPPTGVSRRRATLIRPRPVRSRTT